MDANFWYGFSAGLMFANVVWGWRIVLLLAAFRKDMERVQRS